MAAGKGCTRDLGVVGSDNGLGKVKKGGAGVSNGGVRGGDCGTGSYSVTAGGELPETVGSVDIDVGDGTSVLGLVNVTEVVATCSTLLKVNGEERGGKRALDGVEEGGLGGRLNSVDGGEGKSKETIVVGIIEELAGDRGCSLDSLGGSSDGSNLDLVCIDNTSCTRSVTVGDGPGLA